MAMSSDRTASPMGDGGGGLPAWFTRALLAGYGVLLALCLPLGFTSASEAGWLSDAIGGGEGLDPARGAPLAVVFARVARLFPVGTMPVKLRLMALLLVGLAVFLLHRLSATSVGQLALVSHARVRERDRLHERLSTLGGMGVVLVCPFVATAFVAPGMHALSVAGMGAVIWLGERVIRNPGDARFGLLAALVFGTLIGLDPVVVSFAWPIGLLVWFWCLRGGQRWPTLAPFIFACGVLCVLPILSSTASTPGAGNALWERFTLGTFRHALSLASGAQVLHVLQDLVDALGIVAILLGVVGVGWMVIRLPVLTGAFVFALWTTLLIWAAARSALVADPNRLASARDAAAVACALCGLPIAVGILRLSTSLGQARAAASAALAVIAVVVPLLSGGPGRFTPDVASVREQLARQTDAVESQPAQRDPAGRAVQNYLVDAEGLIVIPPPRLGPSKAKYHPKQVPKPVVPARPRRNK
ncbi:MAG: hypothetical protein SGI86_19425 [Deltaproteobacteria bacterium]|nr:hypothetical protein [Deltaproteobacteria bacterium]